MTETTNPLKVQLGSQRQANFEKNSAVLLLSKNRLLPTMSVRVMDTLNTLRNTDKTEKVATS